MSEGWLHSAVERLRPTLDALGLPARGAAAMRPAWAAWRDGSIELAHDIAERALDDPAARAEARHLLCLTAAVRGDHRSAIQHFRAIDASYRRRGELPDPVIDAHVHLGELPEALAVARSFRRVPAWIAERLGAHLHRPLHVTLAGVADIPFADHPLTAYFPAFDTAINGQRVTAHIDTGGPFLVIGPARAAALGIDTKKSETSRAHLNQMKVRCSWGIADEFVLGNAVLRNVPVDVLSTLTGDSDLVIFGTNILERFLSTMDYPNRRLLLSRRGDADATSAHRALLPREVASMPFYLWSDHFMFSRGGLGPRRDLNFFVDSGLLSLHPDGRGGTRQASFTSSGRVLRSWGVSPADVRRGYFESPDALTLGDLREDHPLLVVGAAGEQCFGGVRIDGLISHAFLKRYAWTVDFDAHVYRFGNGASG